MSENTPRLPVAFLFLKRILPDLPRGGVLRAYEAW